ncbi:heat shock 22 kDa protein, mitochondrial-like [Cornus florida]|uniref:heat shock 22 kDa protein, mitochondrial-like n=1 Tax=Cornus florida TaxID=4283 RepID=UPI00289D2965|nr:heat shock 22 kDa protein, mitochondrial-like [Cornus florida]
MAFSTLLPTTFSTLLPTHLAKPFPPISRRSSTTLVARSALIKRVSDTVSDSDSNDSDAPYPKGSPLKNPFLVRGRAVPYVNKHTNEWFELKVDLPGISKEDLRVWVENHRLNIMAVEEDYESDDEEEGEEYDNKMDGPRKYFGSIPFPEYEYEKEKIRAKMRNGVLKLVVPKRKGIITINVKN